MSTVSTNGQTNPMAQELSRFQQHWWLFTLLGVLLIICGLVALAYPMFSSVSVIIVIAAALIVGGVAMVVAAFWTGSWSAFLLQMLVGILYIVLGMMMTDAPLETTAVLTLFVASLLLVVGIFRIVAALVLRFPQWGWALLNGIVTVLLGLIIYRHFPAAALVVIGIFVGVEMLLNGLTWIMLSFEVRNLEVKSSGDVTVVSSSS